MNQKALDGNTRWMPTSAVHSLLSMLTLAAGTHIWVEDLGQEVGLGWEGKKVLPQQEFHVE